MAAAGFLADLGSARHSFTQTFIIFAVRDVQVQL